MVSSLLLLSTHENLVIHDLLTEELKDQVKQQRQKLKRKARRILAHRKAEQRLLKRKVPKGVSKVLKKFPNIGRAPTPRSAVPYACAQPYHPGSGSHGQLFRPC